MTNTELLLVRTREAQGLALAVYSKYVREGMTYKRLKASKTAIKANEHRQELAREVIDLLNQLERKYYARAVKQEQERYKKAMREQWEKHRFIGFTVNRR